MRHEVEAFRIPCSATSPVAIGRRTRVARAAVRSKRYEDEYCEIVADAPPSIRERLAELAVD